MGNQRLAHVKNIRSQNGGMSFKEVLKLAKKSYKKKSGGGIAKHAASFSSSKSKRRRKKMKGGCDDDDGENLVTAKKKGAKGTSQRRTTDMIKVQCFDCKRYGHYANTPLCPNYREGDDDESGDEDVEEEL